MRKATAVCILGALALIQLLGCRPFAGNLNLAKNVSDKDLANNWVICKNLSIDDREIKYNFTDGKLALFENGRFLASEIPVNKYIHKWIGRYLNGEGQWKLLKHQNGTQTLQLSLDDGTGIDFEIMESSEKLFLVHILEQPDANAKVVLKLGELQRDGGQSTNLDKMPE